MTPPLTEGYTPPLLTEGYMPPSPQLQQYLQSNEEEPYYILKTNNPVFWGVPDGDDTSCDVIPVRAASGDVTSSNARVMARSPLLPRTMPGAILIYYLIFGFGEHPINNP
jgi:hypothetical protein